MAVDGASVWKDWFYLKYYPMSPQSVDAPVLWAWTQTNALDQPVQVLARNPYYWKVDTDGRQLPYVDRIVRALMPNSEAMLLKAVAGEVLVRNRGSAPARVCAGKRTLRVPAGGLVPLG
ncbi:MAG: hypothetical protein WDA75_08850 [Candidatus Latescibacterota bacterium]|jgi:peptide/nickel transport system substrate-binding protein